MENIDGCAFVSARACVSVCACENRGEGGGQSGRVGGGGGGRE